MAIDDEENDDNEKLRQSLQEGAEEGSPSPAASFVDYTPAPLSLLPPAKYKLAAVIIVLVYLAAWFSQKAGFLTFLQFGGWLSPGAAQFLFFCVASFVLAYGALDVLVAACTVKLGGKTYGLGAWLRAPRATWPHRCDNFLFEGIAGIVHILENGFGMFDAPPEARGERADPPLFTKTDCADDRYVELRIEHRICPTKVKEYARWCKKIGDLARRKGHGLVDTIRSQNHNEYQIPLDVTARTEKGGGAVPTEQSSDAEKEEEEEGILFSIRLIFKDIDCLNEWMASPRRRVLLEELRGYVARPSTARLRTSRDLPEAFTDLAVQQGRSVPVRAPKKWKVWWLTTVSLFASKAWSESYMRHYYEFWGMNDVHERLKALVSTPISVFTSSYIVTPLLLFLFAPWLRREGHEAVDDREPWRTLNEGVSSLWLKVLLTFVFYGGLGIAWVVKDPTFP